MRGAAPSVQVQVDLREREASGVEPPANADRVPVNALDVGGIVARCSVARGRALSPGVQKGPFYWRDVVHGPPPRRREKGDCIHVTWHGSDDSGDVRLAFTSLVRVDPGMDKGSAADDIIHVEERVYVQRRVLQELVDRERAFTDRICLRMRSRLAQSMVRQRRRANLIDVGWVAAMALGWIRLQAKVGNGSIRAFRGSMRALVAIPDALLTHTERASIHLASRSGRRWLRRAIRDPAAATPQEKAGVLVWLAFATAGVLLLMSVLFATVLARWDGYFAPLLGDFLLSLGGTVGVPFPSEPVYISRALAMGFALGGVGLFAGKLVGSWMLYLLGDSLYDTMEKKSGPRMRRAIAWLKRNADRWGFAFLTLINAIPLAPDAFILVFAVSGMRFRSYMISIALGAALKCAILAGLILWVGPDTVQAFVEHPIQTLRGA